MDVLSFFTIAVGYIISGGSPVAFGEIFKNIFLAGCARDFFGRNLSKILEQAAP